MLEQILRNTHVYFNAVRGAGYSGHVMQHQNDSSKQNIEVRTSSRSEAGAV